MSTQMVARRGRGRPATGKDPILTTRMPQDLIRQIEIWADAHALSRSEAIRRLICASLNRVIETKRKRSLAASAEPD